MKLLLWLIFLAAAACFVPSVEAQWESVAGCGVDWFDSLSMMTRLVACLACLGLISGIAAVSGRDR